MTPVFPYLVRRSEDGWRGELLLRLKEGKSVYVVHLSMEQARVLAVEMRGLATDHCPQHHLALLLARSLGANISHVVIQRIGPDDEVLGVLRLVTADGLRSVNVDAAAALAMGHPHRPSHLYGRRIRPDRRAISKRLGNRGAAYGRQDPSSISRCD